MLIKVNGNGSYLGVVDVGAYVGFVGRDWASNPKLLEPHFVEQMGVYSGLFWDTNLESGWLVDLSAVNSGKTGYREFIGSIKITDGRLIVLDYDALTMMAQFEEHTIDEFIRDNVLILENGNYTVKVIQLFDPSVHFPDGKSTDFLVEVTKTENLNTIIQSVPWSKLR